MMRLVAERLNREGHPVHVVPQLGRSTMAVADGLQETTAQLAAPQPGDVVVGAQQGRTPPASTCSPKTPTPGFGGWWR